jgi:hypothetical protein
MLLLFPGRSGLLRSNVVGGSSGSVMAILWGFSRFAMSRRFQLFSVAVARLGMV